MKLNSPLPQPLSKECLKAAKIFKSFVDNGNNGLDGVIPRHVLQNARGFAIFTIVKAGFIFSARAGSGVVIAKLDDGTWSAPSAIGTAGLGVGGQVGAEVTDFLIVLNNRAAITSFMAAGSLTLGGNMSIALGPLGRNGEAAGSLNTKGKMAAMYSYSKTRGLFGGVSLEGSVIVDRQDANAQAYRSPVTARLLLGGTVEPPSWALPLIRTLESCTGLPGSRDWIDDYGRTPGRTYAFGGLASPGSTPPSPSFLRKKKKEAYPPATWGKQTDSGSYFSNDSPTMHSRNQTWDLADSSTSNFETRFDSDYAPERRPPRDPFSGGYSHSRTPPIDEYDAALVYDPEYSLSSTTKSHSPRSASLGNIGSFRRSPMSTPKIQSRYDYDDDDYDFRESRPKFNKPLQPHEGVARAIALYEFQAVESGDLSFHKGDVIHVTKKSENAHDWWTGKVDGREGIFPANFVEVV